MRISPLSVRPDFADAVADRGWRAWWSESGLSLAGYRALLDPMIASRDYPAALVAHEGGAYRGSVLLIEDDLAARPGLTPWIAALWVDPAHRRQGLAGRLIGAAREQAARAGFPTCHLCATPDKAAFYLARGFARLERDVEGLDVFVIPSGPAGAEAAPDIREGGA
ncbi:GNAT family N-acetyltransferase [Wenxinia saemankumensis]|uniref:Acetyltransferase (GNAT) family protein n=1 Tax=Wenxinia saemankumensis TaxID=1447782 RepID=A0A1M6DRS3_9RHOB|nr:GNAT family N-acetyltransferase [Wenxinia saemankumensis]SHI75947.1 Acetyltransferase (GNAT) family protein [Wenxinia saemankumensis]